MRETTRTGAAAWIRAARWLLGLGLAAGVAVCGHAQGTAGIFEGPQFELRGIGEDGRLEFEGRVPAGFRHVILEESVDEGSGGALREWLPCVSGPLSGARASVFFRLPMEADGRRLFRIRVGTEPEIPEAAMSGPEVMSVIYDDAGGFVPETSEVVHVLNRVAYGPSPSDFLSATVMGPSAWIEEQLVPESIDESDNARLKEAEAALYYRYLPNSGTAILEPGAPCRYFKGTQEPPSDWAAPTFDDNGWLQGVTGIGYGDDDDATVLDDMQGNYLSVYVRQRFTVEDVAALDNLILRLRYDDGFVAYVNGVEVARENVSGSPPAFDASADRTNGNVDGGGDFEFDLTDAARPHLVDGENILAFQVHNAGFGSSDLSLIPELADVPSAPYRAIRGKSGLKQLLHVRGVYARRQLQAVLGEFWENHFTTDYDKVLDHLENLDAYEDVAARSDADEDAIRLQARTEAARMEWEEYQFFHDHALGSFGDLLLYSATSPSMLIYLDSILNVAGAPNENYAREILELHSFGVDNRYTQADIEELARCFTGWTIRKMRPGEKPSFPDSARTPPLTGTRSVESDDPVLDLGAAWRFFRGTTEPAPGPLGEPTAAWTAPGFDDAAWETGATGIGYGDSDDATELADMRGNYLSVYLRTSLVLPDPATVGALVVSIDYDDGYVLYLNGTEIDRSYTMRDAGSPPPFDAESGSHEAGRGGDVVDLADFSELLVPGGENTLAIQVHNTDLTSSDLSILPRVLVRTYTPDSVDVTDPAALWTFRFDPDEHDLDEKVIFAGTPWEIRIPAGRSGADGLADAIDVVDALVGHPSTAEFITLKLVNRFVSDEISLDTYHDRSAPDHLLGLMDTAIQAWYATEPPGHIGTVMRTILDPGFKASPFWSESAHLGKVKTPIELMHSVVRALDADIVDDDFIDRGEAMNMSFFDRDDPDGWPETGPDWVDTLSLLERMRFSQAVSQNLGASPAVWNPEAFLAANGYTTIEEVLDHFDALVFGGTLSPERRAVILDFANTDADGNPSPFEGLGANQQRDRLEETIALILSVPEFQYQ